MGYCFMTIDKIHSLGELTAKYNHNYRKIQVDNADPRLSKNNEELVHLPISNFTKKQLGYAEAFQKRLDSIPYYKDHAIRKGGVLAYEIVLTYSREDNIDIESWKKKNIQWLKNTFDKSPDGKSNVLSVVYHADEPGNVHCHAIVTPIDERGKLNASRFTNGWRAMTDLQTSYANEMKEFGLERGLEGGQAKHRDIKKYYADLNNAKKLPEPMPEETADLYKERIFDNLETLQLAAKRKRDIEESDHRRKLAEERVSQREMIRREAELSKKEASVQVTKIQSQKTQLQKEVSLLRQEHNILHDEIDKLGDADIIAKKIAFYDTFQKRVEILAEHDPERAIELRSILQHAKELEEQKNIYR